MSIFEALKEQVPLDRIIQANGSGKVRCVAPNHRDANPSMYLYDDHTHCFTCGFHGDVTDVWAARRDFDRPIEAALDLAREFDVELPEMTPVARQKIQQCREQEDMYLEQARVYHRALERHPHMIKWWEGRGFGEELRERFLLGANKDGTAAVVPFWHRGRVQGLIRRKLEGEPKYLYPKAQEFPGGYRLLFIPGSLWGEVFLVEGIVDALAIAAFGESAIAVGGTNISEPQMRELKKTHGPLYIIPDADEQGEKAATEWVRRLYPKALLCPPKYGEEEA